MASGYRNRGSSPAPATTPRISTGTAAPNTTPNKVGDIYIDTQNVVIYVAVGTVNSGSWQALTNQL